MPDDAVYIDSLGKAFICSLERIPYTYYSGEIDHLIEDSDKPGHENSDNDVNNLAPTVIAGDGYPLL